MMRWLACVWLLIVMVAAGYVATRIHHGLIFQTDLMALLPREDQNPDLQQAKDIATDVLSQHIVIMVGDRNREIARATASRITEGLAKSGLFNIAAHDFDKDRLRQIGTFYFPYRANLLSDDDYKNLRSGNAQAVADRAVAQVYGVVGMANAKMLRADPFLLLPNFLTSLPLPLTRLVLDDGLLSMQDNGMTWIMIAGQIKGSPFALDVQKAVTATYDDLTHREKTDHPDLEILHLGAVFFAKAGAEQAMSETSTIGILSTLGTIFLIISAFRAARPLLLSLLVIGVGVITAFALSLFIFGELHVGALLFGISLIGVCVDYSLQYCSEIFTQPSVSPSQRLNNVLVGITLGTATTVIGYLTLYLAPFPGLHQIALFSAVGLIAAWITVVVWLPLLDRQSVEIRKLPFEKFIEVFEAFWETTNYRRTRYVMGGVLLVLALVGALRWHSDDDVHRMQTLSPPLEAEQQKIQQLIGTSSGTQFFLVQAPDQESALQKEEILTVRLHDLVEKGDLAGFQAPSQYVPSIARQKENHQLQQDKLYKSLLIQQTKELSLSDAPMLLGSDVPLQAQDIIGEGKPLSFLSNLMLGVTNNRVIHRVALDNIVHSQSLAAAADGLENVYYVDVAGDFSRLLGQYRHRAIELLALSAFLMLPLLAARYGLRQGLGVMVPPLLAVALTPLLRALTGSAFTFFDAMALVLVLSVGVDYAVFCAETSGARKKVTLLAITMAACTALMSFGMLAFSDVMAVHNFGATMVVGITLCFLFAPMTSLLRKD